jgi:hypothetical protein
MESGRLILLPGIGSLLLCHASQALAALELHSVCPAGGIEANAPSARPGKCAGPDFWELNWDLKRNVATWNGDFFSVSSRIFRVWVNWTDEEKENAGQSLPRLGSNN